MLKQIVAHSAPFLEFLLLLELSLLKPQRRHLTYLAESVIVADVPYKTLTSLYELIVDSPHASNAADFLRISPWQADEVQGELRTFTIGDLLRDYDPADRDGLYVIIDDSISGKDKDTHALEAVDWHHDHSQSGKKQKKGNYTNGTQHLEVRIEYQGKSYVYDWAIYLREKTVRRLNRKRAKGQRLKFRTKYKLARSILVELQKQLPAGLPVYVLFDSWYASAKLIKFCLKQKWHVVCAIKANRTLDGVQLKQWNQRLKHQPYQRINPRATDNKTPKPYLVRALQGRIKNVPGDVCVLISKRHRGDKLPKYFLCTDLSLSAQQILSFYRKRWPVEVDNYYVKQLLGLGDFRVQSYEATRKWFVIVFLAYIFLQWRLNHATPEERFRVVADVIRDQRQHHARHLLEAACRMAQQSADLEPIWQRFIATPAAAA